MPELPSVQNAPLSVDFESVLNAVTQGIVVLGPDGRVQWANASAQSLLGRSAERLRHEPAETAFGANRWLGELAARVDNAHTSLRAEGTVLGGGETVEVLAQAIAIVEGNNPVQGVVLTLQISDLSLRLSIQDKERARTEELHRLVGQVGHEINNPLSGIRGAAQLLGRKLGDKEDQLEYTRMIVRQTDRMADLVATLMSLEAPVTTLGSCNIHREISDVLLLLQAEAESAGVRITQEFDPSLPDIVGDPAGIQQLFLNLVKNAMTACKKAEQPRVVVRTLMEHGFHVSRGEHRVRYIRVEVRDNGPGLDSDALEHMFEPLYSRSEGGHGMGLAVARSIVTGHRGSIKAENLPEGGACLRVLFEVAEDSFQ